MSKDDWNEGYKFAMERDCSNLRDEIAKLQAENAKLQAELKHSQAMVGMANKKLKEVDVGD